MAALLASACSLHPAIRGLQARSHPFSTPDMRAPLRLGARAAVHAVDQKATPCCQGFAYCGSALTLLVPSRGSGLTAQRRR